MSTDHINSSAVAIRKMKCVSTNCNTFLTEFKQLVPQESNRSTSADDITSILSAVDKKQKCLERAMEQADDFMMTMDVSQPPIPADLMVHTLLIRGMAYAMIDALQTIMTMCAQKGIFCITYRQNYTLMDKVCLDGMRALEEIETAYNEQPVVAFNMLTNQRIEKVAMKILRKSFEDMHLSPYELR
jgi:hypothetical protein